MIAWECVSCGAEVKKEKSPEKCPICFASGPFDQIERRDPTEEEKQGTKKYEEVVTFLNKINDECTSKDSIESTDGQRLDKSKWGRLTHEE